MVDQSTQSIVVAAEPARIMAVIADFPAYPLWAASVKRCEVQETYPDGRARTVRFKLDAGVVKDDYTLAYTWADDDSSVRWELVSGKLQRAQHGSYQLVPSGAGTIVTYSLAVELAMPMLGVLKRKAERVVMDTALTELKKRVEGSSR